MKLDITNLKNLRTKTLLKICKSLEALIDVQPYCIEDLSKDNLKTELLNVYNILLERNPFLVRHFKYADINIITHVLEKNSYTFKYLTVDQRYLFDKDFYNIFLSNNDNLKLINYIPKPLIPQEFLIDSIVKDNKYELIEYCNKESLNSFSSEKWYDILTKNSEYYIYCPFEKLTKKIVEDVFGQKQEIIFSTPADLVTKEMIDKILSDDSNIYNFDNITLLIMRNILTKSDNVTNIKIMINESSWDIYILTRGIIDKYKWIIIINKIPMTSYTYLKQSKSYAGGYMIIGNMTIPKDIYDIVISQIEKIYRKLIQER